MRQSQSPLMLASASLLIGISALGGCGQGARPVKPEIAAYRSGAHDRAFVMAKARAAQDPESRLIAGMAAHALGRMDEAASWLRPLQNHSRPDIRARAQATLGLIELARGDRAEAARLLSNATPGLSGHDARRARMISADLPLTTTSSRPLASSSGAWTIQLGAFRSSANAQEQADRVRAVTNRAGLGQPIVASSRSGRQSLYIVAVGAFRSEREAQRALDLLGVVGIVKKRI